MARTKGAKGKYQPRAKGYIVSYPSLGIHYFVHAFDDSRAKWLVVKRLKRARGFTEAIALRFRALDNTVITLKMLEDLGYSLFESQKGRNYWLTHPLCTCEFCMEQLYATQIS